MALCGCVGPFSATKRQITLIIKKGHKTKRQHALKAINESSRHTEGKISGFKTQIIEEKE